MNIIYTENKSEIIIRDIDIAKSFVYFWFFLFPPAVLFILMGFPEFQLNLFLLKGLFLHDTAFEFGHPHLPDVFQDWGAESGFGGDLGLQ